MHGLKTPISKVAAALRLRGEGLGLRATARILGTHENTLAEWERRFGGMKSTLMLYGWCQTRAVQCFSISASYDLFRS